jgi:hypothetical protein
MTRRLRRRYGRSSLPLAKARLELRGAPAPAKADVDRATAYAWASRSVVAGELAASTGNPDWHDAAVEFAHEAVEHAASAGAGVLAEVRRLLA